MAEDPVAISLFSGAMGLDLGAEAAGFHVRFASDIMPEAIETIRQNRPDIPVFEGDAAELACESVRKEAGLGSDDEIDLVLGGPPCQSFSTAGKRRGLDDTDRGPVLMEFIRLVGELQPRAFILENVLGILSASMRWRKLPYNNNGKIIDDLHGSLLREIYHRVTELGYSIGHTRVMAADYGVPQRRPRVFIVGYRDGHDVSFPEPTHTEGESLFLPSWRTLGDALDGLHDDNSPCAKFSERKLHYLRQVPPGGNWRDLPEEVQRESMGRAFYAKGGRSGYWRRLSFDRPSPTILTEPQNASTSLCHPTEDRPLTVRECARVQTFPDDWGFSGSRGKQYQLVGNAVPPLLAQHIAQHVKEELDRIKVQDENAA